MGEAIGRFKPGQDVTVFAEALINRGRFVAIQDEKTARGDYPAKHASAGDPHPFGVSQVDSAPATQPAHSRERLVDCQRGGIPFVQAGEEVEALDEVAVGANGKAVVADADTAASVSLGVVADNNAVTFTAADGGEDSNDLSITLVDPGVKEKPLDVDVDGDKIIVQLETDAENKLATSGAELIAAIAEDDAASQLIVATNKGASTGAGNMKAAVETPLTGGAEAATAVGKALTGGETDDFIEVEIY